MLKVSTAVLFAAILGTASVASAASGQSCSASPEGFLKTICADAKLAALDGELARLLKLAHDGKHGKQRRADLAADGKQWIKTRDACEVSAAPADCAFDAYIKQIAHVRQFYADAREDDSKGISTGPEALRCEGFDALIGVTFVNGDPPGAYLEWLDQSVVVRLSPSGSGSKYQNSATDGQTTLWTKGEEAQIELPDGKALSCKFEPIG